MRRLVILVALSAAVAAPARAPSQNRPSAVSGWAETATSASAVKAGITLPLSAGTLRKTRLSQYDRDGADLFARYETADRAIQGTIFIYEPTLPDTGLAFFGTDEIIRRQSGSLSQITTDQLISVAGVKAAQRRVIYKGANERRTPLVTIATYIRAGSWIVAGWTTGPAERAYEINKDLDAFLANMTFSTGNVPLPANVIKTERCAPRDRTIDAKVSRPQMGDGLAFLTESSAFKQVPVRLCFESIEIDGDVALQIYRPVEETNRPFITRVFALFGNSGVILEVAESRKEPGAFYALRHGVGRATVFGKFDREPSIGQIRALAAAPDKQPAAILQFSTSALSPTIAGPGVTIKMYCDWALNGCVEPDRSTPKPQSSR